MQAHFSANSRPGERNINAAVIKRIKWQDQDTGERELYVAPLGMHVYVGILRILIFLMSRKDKKQ